MREEKTQVDDIDRSVYDVIDEEKDAYRIEEGLTKEIIDKLSKEKNDPEWMHEFRLKSLEAYNDMKIPDWGPSIEGLDIDHIVTYVRPNTNMKNDWEDVPQDIKETFDRLGIPQAERKSLAGVGAQYDSELVYHNVKDEVAEQGVIYEPSNQAVEDSAKKTYTPNTELINKLKADADERTSQLRSLVEKLITGQGNAIGNSDDIWSFLRTGNFTVDAETKAQAQKDIAEDGYWGVEQTSSRILDFAKALAGNDPGKAQQLLDAFKEGYKKAEETWGDKLPDISSRTYEAVEKKFNDWMNTGTVTE